MLKTKFSEIPKEERIQVLRDNCDASEEGSYMRELGQEELDQKREQHTDNCVKLYDLDEELDRIKGEFKEKMNPLKVENKTLLGQVKTKKEQFNGMLFHFDDLEAGVRNSYDDKGEFISSRRLLPDERQGRLFVGPRK